MKTRHKKTAEEVLAGWMADAARQTISCASLIERGWEAGQVGYIECYGMRYERFPLSEGGFVVVEWDDGGSITVA